MAFEHLRFEERAQHLFPGLAVRSVDPGQWAAGKNLSCLWLACALGIAGALGYEDSDPAVNADLLQLRAEDVSSTRGRGFHGAVADALRRRTLASMRARAAWYMPW